MKQLPHTITLGMLSEEPTEHDNKNIKDFGVNRAQQKSCLCRALDVFTRMLDRSDPIIMSHYQARRITKKHRKPLPEAVIAMCVDEVAPHENSDDENEDQNAQ